MLLNPLLPQSCAKAARFRAVSEARVAKGTASSPHFFSTAVRSFARRSVSLATFASHFARALLRHAGSDALICVHWKIPPLQAAKLFWIATANVRAVLVRVAPQLAIAFPNELGGDCAQPLQE